MENEKNDITVTASVKAPIAKVWEYWTSPDHITKWCSASDDWHTPFATTDLKPGGKFLSRMEAKDGSMGFDFEGVFTEVNNHSHIAYSIADGRKVSVAFDDAGNETTVMETFEPETTNPVDMQRDGWQAILDNFKKYVESH